MLDENVTVLEGQFDNDFGDALLDVVRQSDRLELHVLVENDEVYTEVAQSVMDTVMTAFPSARLVA